MKKKKLLKRIETLEFKLDEFMYLHDHGVALIERLNNQVIELLSKNKRFDPDIWKDKLF